MSLSFQKTGIIYGFLEKRRERTEIKVLENTKSTVHF